MMTKTELQSGLAQCIGTTKYILHWMKSLKYTDGVLFLAENAGCHWLIDAIASYHRKEHFQVWTLKVEEDKKAVLTMRTDSKKPFKVKQEFTYTDFPLDEITFYLIDGILLLTSEY